MKILYIYSFYNTLNWYWCCYFYEKFMNKINIFWKQVSCAWFKMFKMTIFPVSICPSVSDPHQSIQMSVSLPKIYIVTVHLWHHAVALALEITVPPCDSNTLEWIPYYSVLWSWIPSTSKITFSCLKCTQWTPWVPW